MLSGELGGLVVTADDTVTGATIRFGRSFASTLRGLLAGALDSGGAIAQRENKINATLDAQTTVLEGLDLRAAKLEQRYLAQFTAMEQAVSRFKSTGTYLQNLVDQWNSD